MKKKSAVYWLSSLLLVLPACGTVRPKPITDKVASWDGNQQNSGFLRFNEDGSGLISARARERYDRLIEQFGNRFQVPVRAGEGITPGPVLNGEPTFSLDAQHLVQFIQMNRWWKEQKSPGP